MLFFYIRHGDPIYDPDSLTPLGRRQAEAVGRRLATFGIDRIYTSTSARAIQTAEPLCQLLRCEHTELDFANERHAWRELTFKEEGRRGWLCHDPKYRRILMDPSMRALGFRWYEHPAFAEYSFREGYERIAREADAFFAALGYEHIPESGCYRAVAPNDERVALFAHQGFGLAFLSYLLDIPYPQFSTQFDICHTGMTVIDFADEGDGRVYPRVCSFSSDAHIYKDGLPLLYNYKLRF